MEILHVLRTLDPCTGGPGYAVRGLVREQVRAGHKVSVLATTVQHGRPAQSRAEYVLRMQQDPAFAGAEVWQDAAFGQQGLLGNFAFSPGCRRWLRARLKAASRSSVIHLHEVFSHPMICAASLARRYGLPYVIRPAGSLDAACLKMGHGRLKKVFVLSILRRMIRHAARVQAASEYEAQQLARLVPRDKLCTIPLGVSPPQFPPKEAAEEFRRAFPEIHGRPLILCMARLHPIKRIELLVEAVSLLQTRYPDIGLLLVGPDGGGGAAIRARAESLGVKHRLAFAGFLDGCLKEGAFASADVFALTSVHENFGAAVIEAMAHGLPTVVTAGVASHVHVDRSGGGRTVGDTPRELAAGIEALLSADREAIGRLGRAYVEQHLSWPAVARQIEDLYEQVLISR